MSAPTSQMSTIRPSLKLLAVGDCNTKGTGRGGALVEHLAIELRSAGHPCESVNWGHTMTTTREGLARILRDRPTADVVIINYGLVDSWVTSVPKLYVPYFPETRLRRMGRKLLKFTKRRLRSSWIRRWIPTGAVVPLDEYDRNLNGMIAALRRANPAAIVVLWSTPPVQGNPARNENICCYNARLASVASAVDGIFLDSATVLELQSATDGYVDAVHLSAESFRRLGAAIADRVLPRLVISERRESGRTAA